MVAIDLTVAAGGRPLRRTLPKFRVVPWLYLMPALATFVVWIYEPLARAAWLSFHEWNMLPNAPI